MLVMTSRIAILILCLMLSYVQAATERYIIYPEENLLLEERQRFTEDIIKFAGPQGNVYTSFRRPNSPLPTIRFWCADLTEAAYNELRKDKHVLDIHVNKVVAEPFTGNELSERNNTNLFRPTSEITSLNSSASERNDIRYATQEKPVATELRALSQPKGSDDIKLYPNYVYPVGNTPTYIYHVEHGIYYRHRDFNDRQIEWLYTELSRARGADTMTEADVGQGHSTCTASKAVGKLYGASKSATLVVVKMPDYSENSISEVLDTVIDDIYDRGRARYSVVSISWGTIGAAPAFGNSPLARSFNRQVNDLLSMGVSIVCAAGNAAQEHFPTGGLRTYVDTFPALSRCSACGGMLIVGNSDINGVRFPSSQKLKGFQLYAPGVDITCASNTSPTEYKTSTGTSFSAPLVAGVIADLLSTGHYFYSPWWERPGGEYIVWNGVTNAENPPVFESGNTTLLNHTSPLFTPATFNNEQLDVSTA